MNIIVQYVNKTKSSKSKWQHCIPIHEIFTLRVHPPCSNTNPDKYWTKDISWDLPCRIWDTEYIICWKGFSFTCIGISVTIAGTVFRTLGARICSSAYRLSHVNSNAFVLDLSCSTLPEFLSHRFLHSPPANQFILAA